MSTNHVVTTDYQREEQRRARNRARFFADRNRAADEQLITYKSAMSAWPDGRPVTLQDILDRQETRAISNAVCWIGRRQHRTGLAP